MALDCYIHSQGYGFEVDRLYEVLLEIRYYVCNSVFCVHITYLLVLCVFVDREQYDELLMMAWGGSFSLVKSIYYAIDVLFTLSSILLYRNIFDNDDYNQFEVTTDEQFQGVMEIFPYQDPTLAKAPFPRKFPFSAMVYMIYEQLRRFVLHCNDYASKINLR